MDGADPDLELAGGGVDAGPAREFPPDLVSLDRIERWAAALLGAAGETSHDPLPEDRPLKLREHGQHAEHCPACRGRGVETLRVEIQIHLPVIDLAKEAYEMLERSAQTIDGPAGDKVDLSPGDHLHETIISGTLIPTLRSRDSFVGQLGNDGPAQTIRNGHEFPALVIHRLGIGRDPKIESDAFHGGRFSHLENRLKHFKYFDISLI